MDAEGIFYYRGECSAEEGVYSTQYSIGWFHAKSFRGCCAMRQYNYIYRCTMYLGGKYHNTYNSYYTEASCK